jgi:dTDP-4-dehydrorhamnose reductase
MSLLVFGKTGQLALELQRLAPDATYLGRDQADQTNPDACAALIRKLNPDAVINAAAWTDVDGAETQEDAATRVNAETPGALAKACAELGIPLVHVSTDYVFDGTGEKLWKPSDPTGPQNAYGRSKLKGEQAIAASGAVHAIIRTSWVVSAHGKNFVKTMLALGATRDKLTIVADQHGAPTPARDLAALCVRAIEVLKTEPNKAGTYHFAGQPDTTWAGFAREIFAQAGLKTTVEDVSTSAFPRPAKRPANSRLDCTATEAAFGIKRPDWRKGLADILKELPK